MSRDVFVCGVGMIPFTKPGANAPYPQMGAQATRGALQHAGIGYELVQSDLPLALVVLRPDHQVTAEQIRQHLSTAFANWQLPDDVLFVATLPQTSVGKLNKMAIRTEYADLYADRSPNV